MFNNKKLCETILEECKYNNLLEHIMRMMIDIHIKYPKIIKIRPQTKI